MENSGLIAKILSEMNREMDKPLMPIKRFVDIDITSSFAHLVPNFPVEEIFGYYELNNLVEKTCERLNISLYDYDGILPENEKPHAGMFETPFRKAKPKLFFEERIPIFLQKFEKEKILEEICRFNFEKLARSSVKTEDQEALAERISIVINNLKNSAENSSTSCEFLSSFRKNILKTLGIETYGIAESTQMALFAQKLQEDIEAGFKFYKELSLPSQWASKHMTNSEEGTYLFKGINKKNKFTPVRFFTNPDRFEFLDINGKKAIPAEECPDAVRKGILFPTVTMLTYIVLSPARKPRENNRKTRIHIGGTHMASKNGYAREIIDCINEGPAYDRVKLLYTGYDGRGKVTHEENALDSIGFVMPHFGPEGLLSSLKTGFPFTINRSAVYKNGKAT